MPTPNPRVAQELARAKEDLQRLKDEKARLYPANPHPFVEPDRFPADYTPQQIRYRAQLVQKIEDLERRIQGLEDQLYIQ